jgi:hypothetical protein
LPCRLLCCHRRMRSFQKCLMTICNGVTSQSMLSRHNCITQQETVIA